MKYFNEKKSGVKNISFPKASFRHIDMKYLSDLIDFWKSSEKHKKKVLFF